MHHDQSLHEYEPKPFWGSRYSIGLIIFSAIAAYFLLSEHRAHFFVALPFLLLLACPLMHVFMHQRFGAEYEAYAARTPRFVPSLQKEASAA